jgi:hypothetical protein
MGKKQPAIKVNPDPKKLPRHLEPYNDDKQVFWSFSMFDPDMQFPDDSWKDVSFMYFATAIKSCEQRTWTDIEANHNRDHPIEIWKLEKFARDRLGELQLDDIDVLWSLHFDGLCRLWGIRNQTLYQIIWLDPRHAICPSAKKGT